MMVSLSMKINRIGLLLFGGLVVVAVSIDAHSKDRKMNRVIHQRVMLDCDAHRAFQMFTVDKNLESWLTVVADVEPVVGGKYECFWDPDNREDNSTIGCKVTAVEKDKLIAFEWRGPVQFKSFMNFKDPLTHVVVAFLPLCSSTTPKTEVYMVHSGWRDTEEWEEARLYFVKAWEMSLERLVKVVEESKE